MRTTVKLDPEILEQAKKVAAENGRTLNAVIEDALRDSFSRQTAHGLSSKLKLPTFGGEGVRAGVNLDDSAALLELMESDRDSRRRQRADLRPPRRRG
ncbi:MAG TPA: Arc family DNA-binding protein [Thermoanaerobaculia bacterium]|nr:Arc family DNA-binding protein [Thermoanaerobaculia bacterium]